MLKKLGLGDPELIRENVGRIFPDYKDQKLPFIHPLNSHRFLPYLLPGLSLVIPNNFISICEATKYQMPFGVRINLPRKLDLLSLVLTGLSNSGNDTHIRPYEIDEFIKPNEDISGSIELTLTGLSESIARFNLVNAIGIHTIDPRSNLSIGKVKVAGLVNLRNHSRSLVLFTETYTPRKKEIEEQQIQDPNLVWAPVTI